MPHDLTDKQTEAISRGDGHLRVLGPPGSGKTALLLERFLGAADGAALITYTRESRDSFVDALLSRGTARFGKVPVYTYNALVRQVIASNPSGVLRVVGELEEAVLLRRLLPRIADRLESDYRSTLRSGAFQERVLGVVNSLLQQGTEPEQREMIFESAGSKRVRDLFTICFEFSDYLESHGYLTHYNAAWRAARIVAEHPASNPLQEAGVVLIDDFQDVDGGQYQLVRALAPPDGDRALNVFGDPTGARFRSRGTTDRYLLDVFPRDYAPRDVFLPAGCANATVLGPVVDRIIEQTAGVEAAQRFARTEQDGEPVDVRLVVADDEVAEAAWIARRVLELIDSGECRPEDISVAVRDKSRYEPVLTAAFGECGLVLDTGRRPQHPFEFFVSSLLRLLAEPASESARYAVTRSPFFDALKQAGHKAGLDAGLIDGEITVETTREAIQRATIGQNGAFDLALLLEDWLRPALSEAAAGAGPELLSFIGGLAEEWRVYAEAVEGTRSRRTVGEFLALSRILSRRLDGARIGSGRTGLYSIHELSSRRSPVVIVAGCSELIFPALPPRDDYVPWNRVQEALRAAIDDHPVDLFPARSSEGFIRDEYALMLTALSRAGKRLELTAPKQFGGRATPAPARVLELMQESVRLDGIGRQPAVSLRLARVLAGNPAAAPHLAGRLWHVPPPAARDVVREHTRLSPSALTTWTICARKYFYLRVLRIEGERTAAMAFGTVFHDLMNKLSIENKTHEELSAAIRSPRVDELIEEVIADPNGFAGAPVVEQESARHHLRSMILRFLELDGTRRDGYRIDSSEQYLRFEHSGAQFHGMADRIDTTGSGGRVVIDYKTGKLPKTGATIRRKALAGFDNPDERLWQVPIYARGAGTAEGGYPETFCYYVIRPDGDNIVVGVAVGDEDDATRVAESFGVAKKRIGFMSPGELDESLDEAANVARDVFADREYFVRTDERNRCSRCEFRRVCERVT